MTQSPRPRLRGLLAGLAGLAAGFVLAGLGARQLVRDPGDLADAATVAVSAVAIGVVCGLLAFRWGYRTARPVILPALVLLAAATGVLVVRLRSGPDRLAMLTQERPVASRHAVTPSAPIRVGGDSLLGLMRLGVDADGSGLLPAALDLRGGPGESAGVLVTVTRWSDLLVEEIGYEEPAVAVFRVANPWFLVGTRDSIFGWVRLPPGASVVPLVELLPDRLSYLTPAWNGTLHAEPESSVANKVTGIVRDHGEASVEVLEARQVGDALWLRVRVHRESPCETAGEVEVVAEGWVPAWTAAKPTVWYYSRGC